MAALDGEYLAALIGFVSLFLSWMAAISFAGLRYLENRVRVVVVQGGAIHFCALAVNHHLLGVYGCIGHKG